MAQQNINIGTLPNDGTGDDLRAASTKINDNFTELYGSGLNSVVFLIDNYELPDSATFSGQLTLVNNTNAAYVISTIPADKLNGEDNQAIYTGESFQIVKESTNNYSII